jgi:hypothetical protein
VPQSDLQRDQQLLALGDLCDLSRDGQGSLRYLGRPQPSVHRPVKSILLPTLVGLRPHGQRILIQMLLIRCGSSV